jgi:thioredoxin 1
VTELLNDDNFHATVDESPIPVLVDFYRDGCLPCRRVTPLMCQTAEQYANEVRVVRVNLTQSPALVSQYQIEAAPTLVLLKNGAEIARHRGFIDRAGLDALLEQSK